MKTIWNEHFFVANFRFAPYFLNAQSLNISSLGKNNHSTYLKNYAKSMMHKSFISQNTLTTLSTTHGQSVKTQNWTGVICATKETWDRQDKISQCSNRERQTKWRPLWRMQIRQSFNRNKSDLFFLGKKMRTLLIR